MPIIDVTVPQGAFSSDQKTQIGEEFTAILAKYEGYEPTSSRRSTIWVYVNEAQEYTVGGNLHLEKQAARYRVYVTVPHGILNGEAKNGLVGEITSTLLRIEGTPLSLESGLRVYCLIEEIADGNWGTAGRILRLTDMAALAKANTR